MPAVVFVTSAGCTVAIDAGLGESLLQAAIANDVEGIIGECGGTLACGTCHVYVEDRFLDLLPAISRDELALLDFASAARANSRLCCQIRMTAELEGLVVQIAQMQP